MKTNTVIQFRYPWHRVAQDLPLDLAQSLDGIVIDSGRYSSLTLNTEDTRIDRLRHDDVVKDRKVIRLIRDVTRVEQSDLHATAPYVLLPNTKGDEQIPLMREPATYFEQALECERCGRWRLIQIDNLHLRDLPRVDLDECESGDVVVTASLKQRLELHDFSGLGFRSIQSTSSAWQVVTSNRSVVNRLSRLVKERNICDSCGKPRLRVHEDCNDADVFSGGPEPRIERTPVLELADMAGDYSQTDVDFGTIGRRPIGAPKLDPAEFKFPTSFPLRIVSGRLASLLFECNIQGFELAPAKLT